MLKKKIYAIFDTETVGSLARPLVYDLGVIITDKSGVAHLRHRWLVGEVLSNTPLMQSSEFLPPARFQNYQALASVFGTVPLELVRAEVNQILEEHDVDVISAYNLQFDLRALNNTVRQYLHPKTEFFTSDYQLLDLWNMACDSIFQQKTFRKRAVANGWTTDKGNYKTSAEIAYRYISGIDYQHPHTALEDCDTETAIFAHCKRQKKKVEYGIKANPWRKVQKRE